MAEPELTSVIVTDYSYMVTTRANVEIQLRTADLNRNTKQPSKLKTSVTTDHTPTLVNGPHTTWSMVSPVTSVTRRMLSCPTRCLGWPVVSHYSIHHSIIRMVFVNMYLCHISLLKRFQLTKTLPLLWPSPTWLDNNSNRFLLPS